MGGFFSDLFLFLYSVISHWQAYVTGGAITMAVGLFERLSGKRLNKRTYVGLYVGVFLLAAFFLSWRDQHQGIQQEQEALTKTQQELNDTKQELKDTKQLLLIEKEQNSPKLEGQINTLVRTFMKTPEWEGTGIFLQVTIKNHGAPSIADGYKLTITCTPDWTLNLEPFVLPDGFTFLNNDTGQPITLHAQDMIYEKTVATPIQRGDQKRGWLFYEQRGVYPETLPIEECSYTLKFFDIDDRAYEAVRDKSSLRHPHADYWPGSVPLFTPTPYVKPHK